MRLGAELAKVMVDVLIGEDGPFVRGQAAEERVRVGGAALWAGRGELVDQADQAQLFRGEVGLVGNLEFLHGWRVAAHGLVVGYDLGLDEGTENSSDQHTRGPQVAGSHLHAEGAVRERLRGCHAAPLAVAIGLELRDASLERFQVCRREQIFHAAILAERRDVQERNRNGERRESARRFVEEVKASGCLSIAWTGRARLS